MKKGPKALTLFGAFFVWIHKLLLQNLKKSQTKILLKFYFIEPLPQHDFRG
jgi:hypothetical protein